MKFKQAIESLQTHYETFNDYQEVMEGLWEFSDDMTYPDRYWPLEAATHIYGQHKWMQNAKRLITRMAKELENDNV